MNMRSFLLYPNKQKGAGDMAVILAAALFFFVMAGAAAYFYVLGTPPLSTPKIVGNAIAGVGKIDSYAMNIEIQAPSDFSIWQKIVGQAKFDLKNGNTDVVFDVPSSSFGGQPTSRLETFISNNGTFARYVPQNGTSTDVKVFPPDWFRVDSRNKTSDYLVLEQSFAWFDLTKLLKNGSGFVMTANDAAKETLNGQSVWHISLRKQDPFAPGASNIDIAFFTALTAGRPIDVWVDEKTYSILKIHLTINRFEITATTVDFGTPLVAPTNPLAYADWSAKNEALSIVNLTPITQISLRTYGQVKPAYLDGIRQAILKATGLSVVGVLASTTPPEKKDPAWNATVSAWSANAIFSAAEQTSLPLGKNVRVLYITADKMYSPLEDEQKWSFGQFGSNTAIISLGGLDTATSTTSTTTPTVPDTLVIVRAQKTALQALGETVGFDIVPTATNAACVMRPVASLADLDALGKAYCQPELGYISKVFKKGKK